MRFAKYHGLGNDFVMLADPHNRVELTAALVRRLADRRFGIGADGVIRVAPGTDGAELFMDYVNSDGSIGEMCGNGIRCVALFALKEGLTASREVKVGTRAGLKVVTVTHDERARVDMGPPVFAPADIPVRWEGTNALHAKIELDSKVIEAACVSMGNPHAVLFVDDPSSAPVTTLGPALERHDVFPQRTNVEFITATARDSIRMRVWERGVGETLACGTGACAAAVVARLVAATRPRVTVTLPGGELEIEWEGSIDQRAPVLMTGPAVETFEGTVDL